MTTMFDISGITNIFKYSTVLGESWIFLVILSFLTAFIISRKTNNILLVITPLMVIYMQMGIHISATMTSVLISLGMITMILNTMSLNAMSSMIGSAITPLQREYKSMRYNTKMRQNTEKIIRDNLQKQEDVLNSKAIATYLDRPLGVKAQLRPLDILQKKNRYTDFSDILHPRRSAKLNKEYYDQMIDDATSSFFSTRKPDKEDFADLINNIHINKKSNLRLKPKKKFTNEMVDSFSRGDFADLINK